MTDLSWYDLVIRKLQINGKSERTQEAYTRAVRKLIEHYKKNVTSSTKKSSKNNSSFVEIKVNGLQRPLGSATTG